MKRAAAEPAQRRTASDAGGAGSDAAGARPSHGSEPSSAESGAPEADDVNNDGNGSENSDSVDESGETSSGESSASSAPPSPKVLPSRSTRGRRQTKLVGEAAEADAEFWGQDAFKEDTTDSEFEASSARDSEDSDIDAPEPDSDGEAGAGGGRARTSAGARQAGKFGPASDGGAAWVSKRKNVYVDPALRRKRSRPSHGTVGGDSRDAGPVVKPASRRTSTSVVRPSDRSMRRSTAVRTQTGAAARAELAAARAKELAARRAAGKGSSTPQPRLTQQQLLIEAATTEVDNLTALELQMTKEADRKRQALPRRRRAGRRVLRYERLGMPPTVTFTDVDDFPSTINATPRSPPIVARCAITGKPARFRDPLTKQPYATVEAFKELRRRYYGSTNKPEGDVGETEPTSAEVVPSVGNPS